MNSRKAPKQVPVHLSPVPPMGKRSSPIRDGRTLSLPGAAGPAAGPVHGAGRHSVPNDADVVPVVVSATARSPLQCVYTPGRGVRGEGGTPRPHSTRRPAALVVECCSTREQRIESAGGGWDSECPPWVSGSLARFLMISQKRTSQGDALASPVDASASPVHGGAGHTVLFAVYGGLVVTFHAHCERAMT